MKKIVALMMVILIMFSSIGVGSFISFASYTSDDVELVKKMIADGKITKNKSLSVEYNMQIYGSPDEVSKWYGITQSEKYVSETQKIEKRYLGFNDKGEIITNNRFPDDFHSSKPFDKRHYINSYRNIDEIKQTWKEQDEDEDIDDLQETRGLYEKFQDDENNGNIQVQDWSLDELFRSLGKKVNEYAEYTKKPSSINKGQVVLHHMVNGRERYDTVEFPKEDYHDVNVSITPYHKNMGAGGLIKVPYSKDIKDLRVKLVATVDTNLKYPQNLSDHKWGFSDVIDTNSEKAYFIISDEYETLPEKYYKEEVVPQKITNQHIKKDIYVNIPLSGMKPAQPPKVLSYTINAHVADIYGKVKMSEATCKVKVQVIEKPEVDLMIKKGGLDVTDSVLKTSDLSFAAPMNLEVVDTSVTDDFVPLMKKWEVMKKDGSWYKFSGKNLKQVPFKILGTDYIKEDKIHFKLSVQDNTGSWHNSQVRHIKFVDSLPTSITNGGEGIDAQLWANGEYNYLEVMVGEQIKLDGSESTCSERRKIVDYLYSGSGDVQITSNGRKKGRCYYPNLGTYKLELKVTDDRNNSDMSNIVEVDVVEPEYSGVIKSYGTLKENRKVGIEIDFTKPKYLWTKNSKWEIIALDGQNPDGIYIKDKFLKQTSVQFEKEGRYRLNYCCKLAPKYNPSGLSYDFKTSKIINIEPDKKPIVKYFVTNKAYRDPNNKNKVSISVSNESYSEDNDKVLPGTLYLIYDENDNGKIDKNEVDNKKQVLNSFKGVKEIVLDEWVGKMFLYLDVSEYPGQEYIFWKNKYTKTANSRDYMPLEDETVLVDNVCPLVLLEPSQNKKIQILVATDKDDIDKISLNQKLEDLKVDLVQKGYKVEINTTDKLITHHKQMDKLRNYKVTLFARFHYDEYDHGGHMRYDDYNDEYAGELFDKDIWDLDKSNYEYDIKHAADGIGISNVECGKEEDGDWKYDYVKTTFSNGMISKFLKTGTYFGYKNRDEWMYKGISEPVIEIKKSTSDVIKQELRDIKIIDTQNIKQYNWDENAYQRYLITSSKNSYATNDYKEDFKQFLNKNDINLVYSGNISSIREKPFNLGYFVNSVINEELGCVTIKTNLGMYYNLYKIGTDYNKVIAQENVNMTDQKYETLKGEFRLKYRKFAKYKNTLENFLINRQPFNNTEDYNYLNLNLQKLNSLSNYTRGRDEEWEDYNKRAWRSLLQPNEISKFLVNGHSQIYKLGSSYYLTNFGITWDHYYALHSYAYRKILKLNDEEVYKFFYEIPYGFGDSPDYGLRGYITSNKKKAVIIFIGNHEHVYADNMDANTQRINNSTKDYYIHHKAIINAPNNENILSMYKDKNHDYFIITKTSDAKFKTYQVMPMKKSKYMGWYDYKGELHYSTRENPLYLTDVASYTRGYDYRAKTRYYPRELNDNNDRYPNLKFIKYVDEYGYDIENNVEFRRDDITVYKNGDIFIKRNSSDIKIYDHKYKKDHEIIIRDEYIDTDKYKRIYIKYTGNEYIYLNGNGYGNGTIVVDKLIPLKMKGYELNDRYDWGFLPIDNWGRIYPANILNQITPDDDSIALLSFADNPNTRFFATDDEAIEHIKNESAVLTQDRTMYVLQDEKFILDAYFEDYENDKLKGFFYKFNHEPKFDNNQGVHPESKKDRSIPITKFHRVGIYDTTARTQDDPQFDRYDYYSKMSPNYKIVVHRKPIAKLMIIPTKNSDGSFAMKMYDNGSYDPDFVKSRDDKGIIQKQFWYMGTNESGWKEYKSSGVRLKSGISYKFALRVKDIYGKWSDYDVKNFDMLDAVPPIIDGKVNPKVIRNTQTLNLTAYTNDVVQITSNIAHPVTATLFKDTTRELNVNLSYAGMQDDKKKWTGSTIIDNKVDQGAQVAYFDAISPEGHRAEDTDDYEIIQNEPPSVKFISYNPNPVYEGDDVSVTFAIDDPDNDLVDAQYYYSKDGLKYTSLITKSGIITPSNDSIYVENANLDKFYIKVKVTDEMGLADETETVIEVNPLDVKGRVLHVPKWDENRINYNRNKTGLDNSPRAYDVFWSGEQLVIKAHTTDIDEDSDVICTRVHVKIEHEPYETDLQSDDGVNWDGVLWDKNMINWKSGTKLFIFTSYYSNGTIKIDKIGIKIDNDELYWRIHRAF